MPQCLSLFLRVCLLIPVVLSTVTRSDASPQEPPSGGRATTVQPTTVTGELILQYVDDFARNRSELIHTIRDERTGKSFRLRFERGVPTNLRSGMRVVVRGRAHGSEIHLAAEEGDSEVSVLALDSSSTAPQTAQVSSAATPPVTGDQRTIVIVANFRDAVVNPLRPGADCSIQAIGDRVFTDPLGQSVDALYRDMSAGAVSFSGTVAGPYTLNAASTDSCASNSWAAAADALAIADGVDLTGYARKVYVLPSSTCPAAGLADLGVTPSRAWVFTCDVPHVYAHELGHNLGMHHAATATSEYGDDSDIMGMLGGLLPVDAPHKSQMGWVPDSAVVEISQGGTFDVAPLALPAGQATAPQVLKVRRPDSNDYYYVSYRHGIGFEGNACCEYLDRLSVHRWSGGNDKTYLLASLADGQSYVDPDNGFTVTQLSHGATVAAARIQIGGSCGSTAPTLIMSTRDQSGTPGATRGYDLTVVNNDAAGCAPANLAVQGSAPSAWTTTLSAPSLQLAPGAVGQTTSSVTPPATAPSGTVSVAVNVTDPNTPAHSASTTGSYSVVPACLNRPVASFAVATQAAPAGTALNYSLTVRNTDTAGCAVNQVHGHAGGAGRLDRNGVRFVAGPRARVGVRR